MDYNIAVTHWGPGVDGTAYGITGTLVTVTMLMVQTY